MNIALKTALISTALAFAGQAQAATFALTLTGNVGNFTNFQQDAFGLHFDRYFLNLDGLNNDNAITVNQGDQINSVVTLDQLLTIPLSQVRTDLLQYLFGSGFSGGGTQVSGTFNFYDGATLVNSFNYASSTSSQLASFAVAFPPNNGSFSFDSFTNDLTIDTLDQPATLSSTAFNYNLVSNAVPEPASWALMLGGFGLVGSAMRRRARVAVTYA